MKMSKLWVVVAATIAMSTVASGSPVFYGFDDDTVGRDLTLVRDINANGMVVLEGAVGAIWNPKIGYVHEFVPGNNLRRVSKSGNTVLVNRSTTSSGLWQSDTGLQDIPLTQITANGLTADGRTVVGRNVETDQAFRWNAQTGYQALEGLPGGNGIGQAHDITADGETTIGGAWNGAGFSAVKYNREGTITDLGALDGYFSTIALGVSDNGRFITGVSRNGLNAAAFRWDKETGELQNIGEGLGHASTNIDGFLAFDVSDNGTVVGYYSGDDFFNDGDNDQHALIYDDAHGWRAVEQMLIDDFGIDVSDEWDLQSVTSISPDGTMIGGYGQHITGRTSAWVAVIPSPGTLLVFTGITIPYLRRRRV